MYKRKYEETGTAKNNKRVKSITWLYSTDEQIQISNSWIKEGKIKLGTEFCKPHLLNFLLHSQSQLDGIDERIIESARRRVDPCGKIHKCIFLNRSAIKLANLDYLYELVPRNENEQLLYFASCSGGFCDYLLYKHGWKCRGFGFSLKDDDDDDFELDKFLAPETFVLPYHKNIYDLKNLKSFRDFVMKETNELGVDLVLCDGLFSMQKRENERLYLCQFLCCLMILKPSGDFVCKLFDLFSNFSVGLIYLMYKTFKKISIYKPSMSRPANSERFVICKHKKEENTSEICNFLLEIYKNNNPKEIVPLSVLKSDQQFFNYIYNSNNTIAENQLFSLEMLQSGIRNPSLWHPDQNRIRDEYLKLWNVPNEKKVKRIYINPESYMNKRGGGELFQCFGRNNIYRFDFRNCIHKTKLNLELPAQTVILGKLEKEALYLIDAMYLGGLNIQNLPYSERLRQSKMFAKAVSKPNQIPLIVSDKNELLVNGK